eukprot:TRINITY_DN600_c0_g1_i2.p1 TRINITY_DN600_c0_g1~~TRINITY_DN600_c0_g1_i2.p1  ORF type:complete len:573 (+),score=106.22 TRINITY_DN600_c0_g1_i2:277-1995(+)
MLCKQHVDLSSPPVVQQPLTPEAPTITNVMFEDFWNPNWIPSPQHQQLSNFTFNLPSPTASPPQLPMPTPQQQSFAKCNGECLSYYSLSPPLSPSQVQFPNASNSNNNFNYDHSQCGAVLTSPNQSPLRLSPSSAIVSLNQLPPQIHLNIPLPSMLGTPFIPIDTANHQIATQDTDDEPSKNKKRKNNSSKQNNSKTRKKTTRACVYCQRSHSCCDSFRPCSKCLARGIGHLCRDSEPKKTKKKKFLYLLEDNSNNSNNNNGRPPLEDRRRLSFTKMHGLGNDFVVVDARKGTRMHEIARDQWSALARAMCDRHFGVGADQMLLVCEASSTEFDFMMKLYNVDGFEAEMCGNGVRCIGKFAYEEGICRKETMLVETLGGIKRLSLQIDPDTDEVNSVAVWMGVPVIEFRDKEVAVGLSLEHRFHLTAVNMGNPHAVAIIDKDVHSLPLHEIGPAIEHLSALFPNRTNFEIVNVIINNNNNNNEENAGIPSLRVRVWERSAGITMACGTGACASVVAAKSKGLIKQDSVEVQLPGGTLVIEWDCKGEVIMKGPATKVFDGSWLLQLPYYRDVR